MEQLTVHGPGDVQGEPVVHGDEYAGFVVDCYGLDEAGRLLYDSAFLSRPKGADKSGMGSRFGLFEGLGPCRFAGWAKGGEVYVDPFGLGFEYRYQPGEPMGRPVHVPFVRILATEEEQTGNVYDNIYFNLTEGLLADVPGIDPGLTRTNLPGGGEITPSTASSSAKDGGKETWSDFDETHLYVTPELRRMYATVTRNMRKRKKIAGTWFLETTTMFAPGQESIAQGTYDLAEAIAEGRSRRSRLLYDHRWGEVENVGDEDALRAAIVEAFGEAIEWNDLDGIVDQFYDPRNEVADSRRYFTNALTATSDAWMWPQEWAAVAVAEKSLHDGDLVTLGFDGAVRDDATALVACRVDDGHLQLLGCWEKPTDVDEWRVSGEAVDAAVYGAFERFDVAGFYADPPHWQDYIDRWTREFGSRVRVSASQRNPLEWWTNRPTAMVAALERFHSAVRGEELTHDGDTALSRHVLNARRRETRAGIQIGKEHPHSSRKIDAAMAAVLAYEARADAVAKGINKRRRRRAVGF